MHVTAISYYLAALLAALAAVIYVIRDGFVANEYVRVGILAVLAVAMVLLGNREAGKNDN